MHSSSRLRFRLKYLKMLTDRIELKVSDLVSEAVLPLHGLVSPSGAIGGA